MRKVFEIAFADLVHNFRSLFAIGMMFAAPLLITGLIFFAFGGAGSSGPAIQPVKVVIANLDVPSSGKKPVSKTLVDLLEDASISNLIQAREVKDEAAARAAVAGQQAGVAVIIPANFSDAVNHGKSNAEILIVQDPTLTIGPSVIKNLVGMYLDGINGFRILIELVTGRIATAQKPVQAGAVMDAVAEYKDWFTNYQDKLFHSGDALTIGAPTAPQQKESSQTSSSGMGRVMGMVLAGQMLFFAFYTGAYSMMSILREQELGTLARLFTTPTDRTQILAGKFTAVVLMVLVQSVVMLTIGALAFKIYWGEPVNIILVTTGQVVAASGLGVLLISFVKTSKQAGPVLGGGLTMLGMLGGLFTSSVEMPAAFKNLATFTPQGWAINGWKLAMNGSPAADLTLTFVVLVAIGLAMFIAGAAIFRRRFA